MADHAPSDLDRLLVKNTAPFVFNRDDATGHDQGRSKPPAPGKQASASRPWLVLSGGLLHEWRLFIGAPVTHARTRQRRNHLVANRTHGELDYVDPQQVWTFLDHRLNRRAPPAPIAEDVPPKVRDWLKRHFAFSVGFRRDRGNRLCQGRIVGMRLSPKNPSPRSTPRSDLDQLREQLLRLGAIEPLKTEDWLLPAMVVTADGVLAAQTEDPETSLYSMVTLVPLVSDEALLALDGPKVARPRPAKGRLPPLRLRSEQYAPVTQLLLTLDHAANAPDGVRRVLLDLPEVGPWYADDETRMSVLGEILSFLGVSS